MGLSVDNVATPMAFSSSDFAARCSIVLTLIWYLGACSVAETVSLPSFSQ